MYSVHLSSPFIINAAKHRDDSGQRVDVVWRYGTSEIVARTQVLLGQLRREYRRAVSDVRDNDTAWVGGVRVGQQNVIRYQSDTGESLLAPRGCNVLSQIALTAASRQMRK